MQVQPKISVIMPTYKVEKCFAQCIESVMASTLTEIEIIPVDDGSPDACGTMMDAYAQQDKRIKPIHQPNGGYGKAVNAGLAVATGKYIAIIETDDFIKPTMFETLYNLAEKHEADVAKGDFYYYRGQFDVHPRQRLKEVYPEETLFTFKQVPELIMGHPSIWSALYRRDFLDTHKIRLEETQGASYQDVPFVNLVYANNASIVLSHSHLMYYRVEPTHQSSTLNNGGKGMLNMPKNQLKAKNILKQLNAFDRVKEHFYQECLNGTIGMACGISSEFDRDYFDACVELFKDLPAEKVYGEYFDHNKPQFVKIILNQDFEAYQTFLERERGLNTLRAKRKKYVHFRFNRREKILTLFGRRVF